MAFEAVSGARLAELQPGLAPRFSNGVFVPEWMTLADPYQVTTALGAAAVALGAVFERGEVALGAVFERGVVARVVPSEGKTHVMRTDGRRIAARQVVVTCGAWSHHLAAGLGDRIPLKTERGYNTTLPPGAFDLHRQLVIPGDGYVITPPATGIRIGGAVELAGLSRAADYRRAAIMLKKAEGVLSGLKTAVGSQWMGFRPSLPDSLPVIGRSPCAPGMLYAFGHGHLGLTQAAATALLVADLALDRTPAISLVPYRPERF